MTPKLTSAFRTIFAALFAALVSLSAAAADDQKTIDEQLFEEIRRLNETMNTLEKKMSEIEESMWQIIEIHRSMAAGSSEVSKRARLATVKLPENPTGDDIRTYVRDILGASRNQTTFGSSDPQAGMLRKIGSENLDILIEFLDAGAGGLYVKWAIEGLVRDEHKQQILDALPVHRDLVSVVVKMSWEADARDILLDELKSKPRYLPGDWIQATVMLRDPETYDPLVEYFVNGFNRSQTYGFIKDLPVDLDDAAARAWKKAKSDRGEWDITHLAPIAVSHGVADALRHIVDSLETPPENISADAHPRRVMLRHTVARGDNQALKQWYRQNRATSFSMQKRECFV